MPETGRIQIHEDADDMLNPVIQSFYGTGNSLPISNKQDECDNEDISPVKMPIIASGVTSQDAVLLQTKDDVEQHSNDSIGKWVNADKRRKTECDPYPQNPYLRKFYSGKDKNLPKKLKELFTPLKCNLCHCSMGSTVTAKDHYDGKKHVSNIKKWLSEHPEYNDKFCLTDTNQQKIIDPDRLYCKYCDVTMSSEQQAQSHYIGKKHQSVINSGVMKNAFFNTKTGQWERRVETPRGFGFLSERFHGCRHPRWNMMAEGTAYRERGKERKENVPLVIDVEGSIKETDSRFGIGTAFVHKDNKGKDAGANQRFFCETCQVACPSQITFNDHLAGARHKKKMTLFLDSEPNPATKDNILEDVIKSEKKTTSPADLSIYRTPSGKYYCHSCNVTVNSPIQFLQHSESRKHKHKSTNKLCK